MAAIGFFATLVEKFIFVFIIDELGGSQVCFGRAAGCGSDWGPGSCFDELTGLQQHAVSLMAA
mgnify:CR=1 FL=1